MSYYYKQSLTRLVFGCALLLLAGLSPAAQALTAADLEKDAEQSLQTSSRWVYTVRVDAKKRDKLLERLNARGIKAGLVHTPNDGYTSFKHFARELPGVREFAATQLSLPCGWWVDSPDVTRVAEATLEELHAIN